MGHVRARGGCRRAALLGAAFSFLPLPAESPSCRCLALASESWGRGAGGLCHLTSCVFEQAPILSLSFLIYKGKPVCLAGSLPGLKEMMGLNHSGWHSAPDGLPEWGQVLSSCVCTKPRHAPLSLLCPEGEVIKTSCSWRPVSRTCRSIGFIWSTHHLLKRLFSDPSPTLSRKLLLGWGLDFQRVFAQASVGNAPSLRVCSQWLNYLIFTGAH